MSKTKFYVGYVEERHGEFECHQKLLFKTWGCPDKYHDRIVKGWYGCADGLEPAENNEGWYWNDYMMYGGGGYAEVSKAVYNELKSKSILNEL